MELVVTAKIKLTTTDDQKQTLHHTLKTIKQALNFTSKVCFDSGLLSSFKKLQGLVYYNLRDKFELKSQMVCNVCSVVAGSYASMKANGEKSLVNYKKPKFQYSFNRDYSFTKSGLLSIGTLDKRIKVPFVTKGNEQYFDGSWEYGTGTLVFKKGKFYLHISCKKQIPTKESDLTNVVGVDLGMNFIAVANDSKDKNVFYSGAFIKNKRAQFKRNRKSLQMKQTRSSRKRLKQIGNRENRFMTDVNHCISKALVRFAGPHSLIAMEDLTGINLSTLVRKRERYYRVSWAFAQLKEFVTYKALMNQSLMMEFDPKYTSQQCPECGHTERKNRNSKLHLFTCRSCGYSSNDDRIGAMNLKQKGIKYLHSVTLGV